MEQIKIFITLTLVYCIISSCDQRQNNKNKIEYYENDSISIQVDIEKNLKITVTNDNRVVLEPSWIKENHWKIELSDIDIILKRIYEGQLFVDEIELNATGRSSKKRYIIDSERDALNLTWKLQWGNHNTIYKRNNNLLAMHILQSDTLKHLNPSYIKLFCLPFEDWKTIIEVSAVNEEGILPIFTGEIEDYKKIDFTPDCKGEWVLSSIVKRVDTIYAPIREDIRIQVIQDTITSRFFVR